jgi:hypothetical protein
MITALRTRAGRNGYLPENTHLLMQGERKPTASLRREGEPRALGSSWSRESVAAVGRVRLLSVEGRP